MYRLRAGILALVVAMFVTGGCNTTQTAQGEKSEQNEPTSEDVSEEPATTDPTTSEPTTASVESDEPTIASSGSSATASAEERLVDADTVGGDVVEDQYDEDGQPLIDDEFRLSQKHWEEVSCRFMLGQRDRYREYHPEMVDDLDFSNEYELQAGSINMTVYSAYESGELDHLSLYQIYMRRMDAMGYPRYEQCDQP